MRSLFHFPFPCTTTLAATVPLQPEMCHRPHSAPMRRQRRSPALLSAAARPRSRAYLDPAHYHPLPEPLAGKNRTACIPFSPNARERPPSWQHPPEMHAFRDQDGNILAPCIHFRAQSGDSGCMARESCRQGPSFASGNPKPRMARRCCQRRAAFPRQRPAVRPNGLCAMRQRHATRGMAERALRPAARAWPACRMRAPLPSRLCPPPPAFIAAVLCASRFAARIAPTHAATRRAAHCGRDELSIGLFLPPSCCPRRCISLPARRTHPASRADPPRPRPGNKRNNANNSMRA